MTENSSDFYNGVTINLHKLAGGCDMMLVPDLLERGKQFIMMWLKDEEYRKLFGNDAQMYYYNIACVAFGGAPKRYPVRYPLSIALGMVCLCVFILLGLLYCKLREGKWSIRGVAIDVLTSILYLPAFFFAFIYLYSLID